MNTVGKKKEMQKFEDAWAAGFIKQPWALHPYLPHPSVAMDIRPWQNSCACMCVLVWGVPGWHHTVACWEGLLQAHGIYNIYRPPEQMSSLSHSVWLAALHTQTHTGTHAQRHTQRAKKWRRSYSRNRCHTHSHKYFLLSLPFFNPVALTSALHTSWSYRQHNTCSNN